MELSVLIPCLNEEKTLATCINKAKRCIEANNLDAEIIVCDNGSTDSSKAIAHSLGVRVINVHKRGYGAALLGGIYAANGDYCIMADADDSYNFSLLMPYIKELRKGYDLVMGNRFTGGISEGAMPFLNRYLGTPVLSFIGRTLYHNNIGDYNCGMRGFNTKRIRSLKLKCSGMEFASEMIIRCAQENYLITEVPTTLDKDGRGKPPHLNRWRDGFRHLRLLLKGRVR